VYEVIGPIGSGGMGAVYKARDTRLDRLVAIKVVTEALAGEEALRARFEQEARAVAALNHKVDARPVANTEGAHLPFWSPQGTSLAFFADGKLKRIDIASGAIMALADAPNARGGDWGKDGTILFAPDVSSPIFRVPASGGDAKQITNPEGRTGNRKPQFLPDGKHFLFLTSLGAPKNNGVYFGTLDGGTPIRLMPAETGAVFAPPH
jgi:serine/threonine protein kinase